jgi:hypothetical protein
LREQYIFIENPPLAEQMPAAADTLPAVDRCNAAHTESVLAVEEDMQFVSNESRRRAMRCP